ncbi:hypothetical protein TNCV_2909431 [Trichonephila clavipes]|nr:hypothetical protein TNCV_2909431 [Trichonephila clavipes]
MNSYRAQREYHPTLRYTIESGWLTCTPNWCPSECTDRRIHQLTIRDPFSTSSESSCLQDQLGLCPLKPFVTDCMKDESRLCLWRNNSCRRAGWRPGKRYEQIHFAQYYQSYTSIMVWSGILFDHRAPLIFEGGCLTEGCYVTQVVKPIVQPFFQGAPNTHKRNRRSSESGQQLMAFEIERLTDRKQASQVSKGLPPDIRFPQNPLSSSGYHTKSRKHLHSQILCMVILWYPTM